MMEEFENKLLASISLGYNFETVVRTIFRVYREQDRTKIKRYDEDEAEDEVLEKYLKLCSQYLGPCPSEDEDLGFGYTITCNENIPYDMREDIFADMDWKDSGLDEYLNKQKLDKSPGVFKVNLICWFNEMYNYHIFENKSTPVKDADKKLLKVADFIHRRYSEYRFTMIKMINELFYVNNTVIIQLARTFPINADFDGEIDFNTI